MGLTSNIKDNDPVSIRQAIAKLGSIKLGPTSKPKFAGLTLTELTDSRLVASNALNAVVSTDLSSWVTGTVNQINVTDDSDGTITLSTPQDIATTSTPTFGGVIIADGGTIGQATGPLLTFNDTDNDLGITGCMVGIGTNTPWRNLTVDAGASEVGIQMTTTGSVGKDLLTLGQTWKWADETAAHFHFVGAADASGTVPAYTDTYRWQLFNGASWSLPVLFRKNGDLQFVDGTGAVNPAMIIKSSGKVGIGIYTPYTKLTVEGAVTLKEQAAADDDTAAYGQIWVKSDTPNTLWFTDDAGTDRRIAPQDLLTTSTPTFAGMIIANNGTIDAHAGEVLVENNDTSEPSNKSNGYVGVAIIDGTARVYFTVDSTMYYIDGTIVAAAEIVTGNPIGLLLALTYTIP